MVAGDVLRTHRAELALHPGPELLQPHSTTVPTAVIPRGRGGAPTLGGMTGSGTWDTLLQIAFAVALLVAVVLTIRGMRR
ncbi:hypothetical protein GCM10028783_25710 [Modestobacter muralis]